MSGETDTGVVGKRRKPYPRRRQPRKTVFTAAMWSRWLSEQGWIEPPDERTLRLSAGIAEFRRRVLVAPGKEA
jgi:hypothetical protein